MSYTGAYTASIGSNKLQVGLISGRGCQRERLKGHVILQMRLIEKRDAYRAMRSRKTLVVDQQL